MSEAFRRRCMACNKTENKYNLIRIVKTPSNEVLVDKNGKIDVIEWNEDPATFICSALLPAHVMAIDIKEEERFAQVIVADDELSLAIGKGGQNARLAVKLTNWKIDIKSETQYRELMNYKENVEEDEVEEGNDE